MDYLRSSNLSLGEMLELMMGSSEHKPFLHHFVTAAQRRNRLAVGASPRKALRKAYSAAQRRKTPLVACLSPLRGYNRTPSRLGAFAPG
jgi:hypothetical protein